MAITQVKCNVAQVILEKLGLDVENSFLRTLKDKMTAMVVINEEKPIDLLYDSTTRKCVFTIHYKIINEVGISI